MESYILSYCTLLLSLSNAKFIAIKYSVSVHVSALQLWLSDTSDGVGNWLKVAQQMYADMIRVALAVYYLVCSNLEQS